MKSEAIKELGNYIQPAEKVAFDSTIWYLVFTCWVISYIVKLTVYFTII